MKGPVVNGVNGDAAGKGKDDPGGQETIRCVMATGSVDLNVRVFAS